MSEIGKLINEYNAKAQQQQESVDHFSQAVNEYRKDGTPSFYDSIDEVLALRKGARALRDAYTRFAKELSDIEINLLEEL